MPPFRTMHALEWIEQHGRYRRFIGMDKLRKLLGRQKGECTWCGGKLKSNYGRWCSEECRREGYVRRGDVAWPLEQRDKGVCALCGRDTLALKKKLNSLRDRAHETKRCHSFRRIVRLADKLIGGLTATPFDADHIIPVCEGGGLCGLEGFRTLCKKCHKKETAALAKRRFKKPDPQEVLNFTD